MTNRLRHRVQRAAQEPALSALTVLAKTRPEALWQRYDRLAVRAGIEGVHLVLSFDCDTRDDIEVVAGLHQRLVMMGVVPTYAVPGALLVEGRDVYGPIARSGAEFLNHGGVSHTYFDEAAGEHRSCFFYDEVGREAVRRDVLEGQRIVEEVTGSAPLGFRTPHFGTFQRRGDLDFLHAVLREAGCRYSTSTMPAAAFRHGPIFTAHGLPEVPVAGFESAPLDVYDTWGCFMAPDRHRTPADYRREGEALLARFARTGRGVLNVYGDPSHIDGSEEFFDTVSSWLEVAVPTDLRSLLGLVP